MKKAIVLLAALMLICGSALASEVKVNGKVTAVAGDVVTIEVDKGKGGELPVGAAVEVEVKDKKAEPKAPKKGGDMLQGC
jgi:hypothetical protein